MFLNPILLHFYYLHPIQLCLVPGIAPVTSSPDGRRQAEWGKVLPHPILLHLLLAVGISHIIIISWPFKTYGPFGT